MDSNAANAFPFKIHDLDYAHWPKNDKFVGNNIIMFDVGLPHMRLWETVAIYDHWRKKEIYPDTHDQFWLWNPRLKLMHKVSAKKLTGFFFRAPWRPFHPVNHQRLTFLGYPNYWVTVDGRVFSDQKMDYLKPRRTRSGYQAVTLTHESAFQTFLVHRLVALAFIPNPEGKKTINHKDGNKENNHVSNLEYATHQENNLHAARILNPNSLPEDVVHTICRRIITGAKSEAIANETGVPVSTINNIKYRETYNEIASLYGIGELNIIK